MLTRFIRISNPKVISCTTIYLCRILDCGSLVASPFQAAPGVWPHNNLILEPKLDSGLNSSLWRWFPSHPGQTRRWILRESEPIILHGVTDFVFELAGFPTSFVMGSHDQREFGAVECAFSAGHDVGEVGGVHVTPCVHACRGSDNGFVVCRAVESVVGLDLVWCIGSCMCGLGSQVAFVSVRSKDCRLRIEISTGIRLSIQSDLQAW